ncbi:HAD family hydrolase [Lapillicoccus sp.]|uniref:HAD family hydrolase n=1 Tax=Lapillicoccus sp. TaxID=1909287 RepID=UPI0039834637
MPSSPVPGVGAPRAVPGLRRPRLVATDLDGTLLRSDGSVSERTRAALAAVEAVGIHTVLVTARPPRWLDELESVVGAGGIALCGNGAFVYDVPRREVLSHRGIAPEVLAGIVADLRRELPGMGFAAERASGFGYEQGYASPHEIPRDAVCGAIEELGDEPVGKLLGRLPTMSESQFLDAVARVVGDRGIVAYSGAGGLAEISAPGVTKAAALADWCVGLDVEAADVWAFGDMPNDLPMLAWAGTSFAVANGHTDVLDLADHTCPANDEDGVAQMLETLVAQRP